MADKGDEITLTETLDKNTSVGSGGGADELNEFVSNHSGGGIVYQSLGPQHPQEHSEPVRYHVQQDPQPSRRCQPKSRRTREADHRPHEPGWNPTR